MSAEILMPTIDHTWVLAMICCGFVGFALHLVFVAVASHHYFSGGLDSNKGKVFVLGCLALLCFNMFACLLWAIARTDIILPLSVGACKIIYASNFLCYFIGKYILHCLLIFRIYMTFRGSTLAMSSRALTIFITIVSINFFIAMAIWTASIAPSVLQGQWYINGEQYTICTLFSDKSHQNLSVKLSAITVGIEDFIVGTITFMVFLRRFHRIAMEAQDIELLESSTRFGIAAVFSVISTLFLFTFAIPFYPNFTFILAIDATINSLCLFCVLSVGQELYYYVCAPCRIAGNRWLDVRRLHPGSSAAELAGYFMNSSQTDLKKNIDPKQLEEACGKIVIGNADGMQAVLSPYDVHDVTPKPRATLDPVASLILIKRSQSNSAKGVRHIRLNSAISPKPVLNSKCQSAPVPRSNPTGLKMQVRNSNPLLNFSPSTDST